MDDLDRRLSALIAEIRQNPANNRKWRTAMHKLLLEIQQLPGLKKSVHQDYPEALNRTFQWVSREIANFEPRPPSISWGGDKKVYEIDCIRVAARIPC